MHPDTFVSPTRKWGDLNIIIFWYYKSIMNEIIFFLHTITVIAFILGAFAMGKYALISCISLQLVLANLFVVKQMQLFGFNVTCADVFIVGTVLGLNLLQEYWGQKLANRTIWISFFVAIFYLVMTRFHLFYVPNSFDTTHQMFSGILQFIPRITIVSLLVFVFVQRIRSWLYAFLKNRFQDKCFFTRNILVTGSTQLLDTVLFSFFALYGIVGSVTNVIIISFSVKLAAIFLATPFISLSKRARTLRQVPAFVKTSADMQGEREGLDAY